MLMSCYWYKNVHIVPNLTVIWISAELKMLESAVTERVIDSFQTGLPVDLHTCVYWLFDNRETQQTGYKS